MHPARFETVRRAQADRWVHDVAGAAIASDIGVHCHLLILVFIVICGSFAALRCCFYTTNFPGRCKFSLFFTMSRLGPHPSVRQGKGGAEYLRFGQNEFEFANGNKGPSPP
jgi:hypothetical protein